MKTIMSIISHNKTQPNYKKLMNKSIGNPQSKHKNNNNLGKNKKNQMEDNSKI